MILEIIVSVLLLLVTFLVGYARWNFGSLEKLGFKVVKPHWVFGSNHNYINLYPHWEDVRRNQELGPIYGVYEGRTPILYINDPNIIHRILFTDADHFCKRDQSFGTPIIDENIELQNGEKWSILHSYLSPQFTSGKFKNNIALISRISAEFVDFSLKGKASPEGRVESLNVHEWIAPFAVQVIGELLCGIKLKDPYDPKNSFVTKMRENMFDTPVLHDFGMELMQSFPFLLKFVSSVDTSSHQFLIDHVSDILDHREKSGEAGQDMISVLLEMRKRARSDPEFKRLGISEMSVYAQAFEFFFASYGGTVDVIKFLLYHLSCEENAEVMANLQEEIDALDEITYESVSKLEYLGGCLSETLRLTPTFFKPERACCKDWSFEDKEKGLSVQLQKGMNVAFSAYAIQQNEEYFPEPKKFQPERFIGQQKFPKCAFLPFGQGTRQCLGQRLAFLIMKVLLFKVLKEWRLERRPDTKLTDIKGGAFGLVFVEPILIDFVKRE